MSEIKHSRYLDYDSIKTASENAFDYEKTIIDRLYKRIYKEDGLVFRDYLFPDNPSPVIGSPLPLDRQQPVASFVAIGILDVAEFDREYSEAYDFGERDYRDGSAPNYAEQLLARGEKITRGGSAIGVVATELAVLTSAYEQWKKAKSDLGTAAWRTISLDTREIIEPVNPQRGPFDITVSDREGNQISRRFRLKNFKGVEVVK